MKAINAVKKMVAVGTAATMIGATIMGASAAASTSSGSSSTSLGMFPKPFVTDGVPASNFLIAVGKAAAGEDVIGAIDIIQYLQQKLAPSAEGRRARVVSGDYVEIGRPTDILNLGESLGSVVETITEDRCRASDHRGQERGCRNDYDWSRSCFPDWYEH